MEINADFSVRVAVHAARMPWKPSPMAGVERRMLDRVGDEVARATSIVRYAPGSHFSPHVHGGGEEFLVLEGVFQDEHGDYPAGSYVRNPPQTRHQPRASEGCILFVKLWQFDPADRRSVVINTTVASWHDNPARPGVSAQPLFTDAIEDVRMERWAPHSAVTVASLGGIEVLALSGGFQEGGEQFTPMSWLRLPCGETCRGVAHAEGCLVWIKTGHLRRPHPLQPGTG